MIERHLRFTLPPEGVEPFREFVETKYVPAMAQTEGFASARLLRPAEGEEAIMMLLQFEDAEAATRWIESEAHASLQPELTSLHSGLEVRGYEVL